MVSVVLGALLFARLHMPSFHDSAGSRATVTATESHAKKQSFSHKNQFQSSEPTQVLRILPKTETLARVQLADWDDIRPSPDTPFYNRPPPHC
jgi:hypothetical protein